MALVQKFREHLGKSRYPTSCARNDRQCAAQPDLHGNDGEVPDSAGVRVAVAAYEASLADLVTAENHINMVGRQLRMVIDTRTGEGREQRRGDWDNNDGQPPRMLKPSEQEAHEDGGRLGCREQLPLDLLQILRA